MKRFTCLSAMITLVLAAPSALAAPSTGASSTRQVAQATPGTDRAQDPPPSSGGASSSAPAAGESAPPPSPGLTLGKSPSTSEDKPTASAAEAEKKATPRPFAGSALFNQNSMTTGTVFRGQQQDYNPTVESSLYILPRYAINEAFQVRARVILSYEYTNSDSTTYAHEPQLSDTSIQLFYRKIPQVVGFQPNLALAVGLPTSKLSRARTMLFTPGVSLQLARPFDHVLGGDLSLIGTVAYAHPIYRSRNPEVVDPRPAGAFSCVGGTNCQDLLSGSMNASDVLSYSVIASMEWGKWNPAMMYLGASQWAYHPTEARNPIDGTPITRPEGFEPTSVRQTHYLSVWVDYNFNSWFTGEVGFWNAVNAIDGAGNRSNLLFDRYQDTRVYLGASVQLDNLVKTLQGSEGGEGGVVRAKNTKQPMFSF